MFQNLVHSQDVLTYRMMVCIAHLCHPPPHHHKKDGASFSLLSITIGKKGDWDLNIPACSSLQCCLFKSFMQTKNVNFDLIFQRLKIWWHQAHQMSTPWPPVKVDLQCVHSLSQVLTTALKFKFKAGREKAVTNYFSWHVNTTSRPGIKQHWKFLWFYFPWTFLKVASGNLQW